MYRKQNILSNIPQAVKGLLIINVAVFAVSFLIESSSNVIVAREIGLYFFKSELFKPYQVITHMFMHGGLMHLVFNMYALWLFGQVIERVWGAKKFLIYFFVTGLGAAVLHSLVQYFQYQALVSGVSPEGLDMFSQINLRTAESIMFVPTVGASGAVFGILLAFGMLFPNVELQLMFVPIPIKAKFFVIGYGALELLLGINNAEGDNIAHFAHLGGMLFGFILIKIWGKGKGPKSNFYTPY
ncbi:MAG: rhomboid family intramembrane serine protease [Bacteroidales bacterium]|nr:rhomboid family intramembrane serine protease [Bacteroidales bacterium]